ncbi:hypothetical protein [Helicobacter pametensis]|uniref:hypothetical protein n=1 Tax=Helicobacter pametensis TaxID=95149 RepID=UPI00048309F8|nr:hypothetical protein [Helicobacter pametensis]
MRDFINKLSGFVIVVWVLAYMFYLLDYGIKLYNGRSIELSENFLIMTFTLLFLLACFVSIKYAQRRIEICNERCERWYKIDLCWRAGVCELLRRCGKNKEGLSKEYLEEILQEWRFLIKDLAIDLDEQDWYIPITFKNERMETFVPTSALNVILHRDLFGEVFAPIKTRLRLLKELFAPEDFIECLSKLEKADQERILRGFFGDERVSIQDLK